MGAGVGQRPDVALGLEGIIVGVQALVLDDIAGVEAAEVDGRDGCDHFVDRAGRISRERTVEQRIHFVFAEGFIVLIERRNVIGRVARHGEDLTRLTQLHDNRAAPGVLALLVPADAVLAQVEDDLLERLLGHGLQGDIDRQLHVVAGHGLGHVIAVQDLAGRGDRRLFQAARAVQVLLKRLLHAGFTDECIHGVALFTVFIGFRAPNWTDVAENVRGVLRVIFAHRAVFDHDARHGQLHDGGEGFRVDVLRQRVVFQADALDRAQLQLVPDGDDAVDVRLLPVVRDLVFAAQPLHERGRGDIEVIAAVGKEFAEIFLPGRIVVVRIFVRPVRSDGEVRFVLDPELVAKVQHL